MLARYLPAPAPTWPPRLDEAGLTAGAPGRARPSVLVVGCGGSISSIRSGDGAIPTLDTAELVAQVPELPTVALIEARTFSVVPSAHMTLDEVVRLHGEVAGAVADGVDGVVVTHGTDTLEETAYALDLLWHDRAPVVVTGAMRNASLASPDGPGNLLASTIVAASPATRGLGALVVMNDEIHAAREVRKTHTSNLAAFRSPTTGPLGYVAEGEARVLLEPRRPTPLAVTQAPSEHQVALLTTSIGDDGRLLPHVLASGYRGLVIEALGGGHLTRTIAESRVFGELVEAIPVVVASRTGAGEALRHTYSGWPGSEMDLLGRGAISGGALPGPQARVLLTFLLAGGAVREEIRSAFAEHGGYGGAP